MGGYDGAGADYRGVSTTERGRGGGGTLDGGSRAYVVVDTAEVLSVRGGGVHQGQECDRHSAKVYGPGEEFRWAKLLGEGYYVSTVGRDEAEIRYYIREQEKEDKRLDQLKMFE